MGLDLTLIPVDHDANGLSHGHSLLQCHRDSDLFHKIKDLEQMPCPPCFTCFMGDNERGDYGYGTVTFDEYGNPLKCIKAAQLTCMVKHYAQRHERNRAIWAYLEALDGDTRIVLFWN